MSNTEKMIQLLEEDLIPAAFASISALFKPIRLDNKITICVEANDDIEAMDVEKVAEHKYKWRFNPNIFDEDFDGKLDPSGFRELDGFDDYLFTYDAYNKRHMEYYKQMAARVAMKISLWNAFSTEVFEKLPEWFVLGMEEAAAGRANDLKDDEGHYISEKENLIKELYQNMTPVGAYVAVMRIGYLYKCDSNENMSTIINRGLNILLTNLKDELVAKRQIQDLHDFLDFIVYQNAEMYVGDKIFLQRLVEEAGDGAGVFSILASGPNTNGDQISDGSQAASAKKRIAYSK